MTNDRKLHLIRRVCNFFLEVSESWEENRVCSDLAYWVTAVVNNDYIEVEENSEFYTSLRDVFPADHEVWEFVRVINVGTRPL
jgi:hypothetical protein